MSAVPAQPHHVYYEAGKPTPPQLRNKVLGCEQSEFECYLEDDRDVIIQIKPDDEREPLKFRLERLNISIALRITVTLPKDAFSKLRDHEEGHRKICEHFYTFAPRAAQRAGDLVAAKEFFSSTKDLEKAKLEIKAASRTMLRAEYWKYTRDLAEQANKYYDELTDHSRKLIDADRAVRESIERFEMQLPD